MSQAKKLLLRELILNYEHRPTENDCQFCCDNERSQSLENYGGELYWICSRCRELMEKRGEMKETERYTSNQMNVLDALKTKQHGGHTIKDVCGMLDTNRNTVYYTMKYLKVRGLVDFEKGGDETPYRARRWFLT